MNVTVIPQCVYCRHFWHDVKGKNACAAYPDGIPEEIILNKVEHTKPYKQNNDIVFEPKEERPQS